MTFSPLRTLTLALTLLAFIVAGCGGESEEEKFANEVNEICTDAEGDIEVASDPPRLVETIDKFVSDLKAAEPPDDKKADYEAWIATQEKAFDEIKAGIRADDQERIDAVDETTGDEQARELGLDSCTG